MKSNLHIHEAYTDFSTVELPSERKFGLTVGGIFIAIALTRWFIFHHQNNLTIFMAIIGTVLVACALTVPSILKLPNKAWSKLGILMARIVNPIVMFAIFLVLFTPVAGLMRLKGRDVLSLRSGKGASSTWVTRDPAGPSPESAINQF